METAWNLTERLVADRRDALESAARRQRLVAGGRPARRFTLRRRSSAVHSNATPTTGHAESLRLA
jgi:hypothetical protein